MERLILADEGAVGVAEFFLEAYREGFERVIPGGEVYSLTELGTHCRGALFLDGEALDDS